MSTEGQLMNLATEERNDWDPCTEQFKRKDNWFISSERERTITI